MQPFTQGESKDRVHGKLLRELKLKRFAQYAAEEGSPDEAALKKAMEAKSKEFLEKGAEVYAAGK